MCSLRTLNTLRKPFGILFVSLCNAKWTRKEKALFLDFYKSNFLLRNEYMVVKVSIFAAMPIPKR